MAVKDVDLLGALNAASDWVTPSPGFAGQVAFYLAGTFVGTLTFQAYVRDPANPFTVQATRLVDGTAVTTASNADAPGGFRVDASGLDGVRMKMTAYTSGAANVDKGAVIG